MIVLAANAIDDLSPVFAAAGFVLTTEVVPANRFTGVWSLADTCWLQKPTTGDMAAMTDADTVAEIMMNIGTQQWYYDKRRQSKSANIECAKMFIVNISSLWQGAQTISSSL